MTDRITAITVASAADLRAADFCTPSAKVRIGRVTIRKDWDTGFFGVTSGTISRSTRSWGRMLNMIVGLA